MRRCIWIPAAAIALVMTGFQLVKLIDDENASLKIFSRISDTMNQPGANIRGVSLDLCVNDIVAVGEIVGFGASVDLYMIPDGINLNPPEELARRGFVGTLGFGRATGNLVSVSYIGNAKHYSDVKRLLNMQSQYEFRENGNFFLANSGNSVVVIFPNI